MVTASKKASKPEGAISKIYRKRWWREREGNLKPTGKVRSSRVTTPKHEAVTTKQPKVRRFKNKGNTVSRIRTCDLPTVGKERIRILGKRA